MNSIVLGGLIGAVVILLEVIGMAIPRNIGSNAFAFALGLILGWLIDAARG